ncbi:ABC transporter permease [Dehalococcoidia bacterium]|nr:ABC transporter permease [Dehalococcoidia bacterium]
MIPSRKRPRSIDFLIRMFREKPLGAASMVVIFLLILVAVFAEALSPYPYDEVHMFDRLQAPSTTYFMGTDQLGRDFMSRIIFGARLTLLIGLSATAVNIVAAFLVGGTTGFLGGKFDLVVQRFVDAWIAFPGLILLLTIMSIVGTGLAQIILVLGISGGISGSRVLRGAVINIKGNDYFLAAQALGSPNVTTLRRHVLPNVMPIVIVSFSITIGGVMLTEASISFLGFGLAREIPTWGGLLSKEGRAFMEQAPWMALWPGLCLSVVIYSLNMWGDAMRDLLDPRLRGA